MPHATYPITCRLSDFDGSPLPFAPVVIRHVGAGLGALGTVADGYRHGVTDATGVVVFQLIATVGDYLGTHYEITSYHPVTGALIHKANTFLVPEQAADVDVLIESSIVVVDPTPGVVAHLNTALATANASAALAQAAINTTTTNANVATTKAAEASTSATTATTAATTATTKASEASASATTATTAAATATTKATEASTSATTATTAATTATTKAGEATTSASSASASATTATTKAAEATTSATSASASATTATTKAAEATTSASSASASATTATTKAGEATTSASSASASATTATTKAAEATTSASSASASATTATTKANEASASAAAAAVSAASAAAGTVNNINGKTPVSGVVTLVPADIGAQPADAKITSFAGVSSAVTGFIRITNGVVSVLTATYLTANQTVTLSGDATGSGATAITVTLANSGVTAGTYNNSATQVRPFTVDAKGRVTSIGSAVTITPAFSSVTGTPTTLAGYGITDAATAAQGTLAATAIQPNSTQLTRIRTLALAGI